MGCTDLEACLYADISKTALYDYQKEHPAFAEHKEKLKETPILLARTTVIKNLRNPQSAQWYLERKKKSEFARRNEFTGPEGQPIPILTRWFKKTFPRRSRNIIKKAQTMMNEREAIQEAQSLREVLS